MLRGIIRGKIGSLDSKNTPVYFECLTLKKDMKTTQRYGKTAALALEMWVKLARAYATFNHRTIQQIRVFGLTQPQFGAIECLGHLGPMSIGELSRKMLVSGGNMTCVIDNLEKESLVERVQSGKDRRSVTVRLTCKGEELFEKIFPLHAKHVETLASPLNADEQVQLSQLLKKLGKALAKNED